MNYDKYHRFRSWASRQPKIKSLYDRLRLTFDPSFLQDGLATIHNADFISERDFVRALSKSKSQDSRFEISWRLHVAIWAAKYSVKIPGDFVECGVYRGFLAAGIIEALNFEKIKNKAFYLIDTYAGPVDDQINEFEIGVHNNVYEDTYDYVMSTLGQFSNVKIVRGAVPEILTSVPTNSVSFLSIDMNCALPERAALEYFYPMLAAGAVVLLDDYGFRGHSAQKVSADEFARSIDRSILSLPTGQGLFIK